MRTALTYSSEYLQIDKPQPLIDNHLEQLTNNVLSGKFSGDYIEYNDFITECSNWIEGTHLNTLTGLDNYSRKDIIIGCTQYIDNIYMQGLVQTVTGDYRYHNRLGLSNIKDVGSLIPNVPLIIALPFPSTGNIHIHMEEILYECIKKDIPVHIDGAWVSCCRNIVFDFSHPSIKSVGISLSKGLGLGWNRVGIRYTKEPVQDSISIMNDFNMNNRALITVAKYFMDHTQPDYLWLQHGINYSKVCNDFNLTETNSIYLALRDNQPVGISPLLRYLENE
jgi:hypothetical protein